MKKFTCEIRMDNDAFTDSYELSRIVIAIGFAINDNPEPRQTQSILDTNGNRVGSWKISEN